MQRTNVSLHRAWLLKEQLRLTFAEEGNEARELLAGWLWRVKRSKIPDFGKLTTTTIERYRPLIRNTLDHGLSNARSEATNTHLRLLSRRSYGFYGRIPHRDGRTDPRRLLPTVTQPMTSTETAGDPVCVAHPTTAWPLTAGAGSAELRRAG